MSRGQGRVGTHTDGISEKSTDPRGTGASTKQVRHSTLTARCFSTGLSPTEEKSAWRPVTTGSATSWTPSDSASGSLKKARRPLRSPGSRRSVTGRP